MLKPMSLCEIRDFRVEDDVDMSEHVDDGETMMSRVFEAFIVSLIQFFYLSHILYKCDFSKSHDFLGNYKHNL